MYGIWAWDWWVCLPVARACHCQNFIMFTPVYYSLRLIIAQASTASSINCCYTRFADSLTHIPSTTRLLIACLSHSMLAMRLSRFNSQSSIPWLQALVCVVFIASGVGLLVILSRMHASSSSSSASAAT